MAHEPLDAAAGCWGVRAAASRPAFRCAHKRLGQVEIGRGGGSRGGEAAGSAKQFAGRSQVCAMAYAIQVSSGGGSVSVAGASEETPRPWQRSADTPITQVTPVGADLLAGGGVGAVFFAAQHEGTAGSTGGAAGVEQQQFPSATVQQPQGRFWLGAAGLLSVAKLPGRGTPRVAARYATRAKPAKSRRRRVRQNDFGFDRHMRKAIAAMGMPLPAIV
jgi:hypothetical protein